MLKLVGPTPRKRPPWAARTGITPVLEHWLESNYVKPCLMADELLGPKEATHAPLPDALSPPLRAALAARGITELYSHQAAAFEIASRGKSFVVATPTASGKSLCFHLPVLETLLRDPDARAIYL